MTPRIPRSRHVSTTGLLVGVLSLSGCGAANDSVKRVSGAGPANAVATTNTRSDTRASAKVRNERPCGNDNRTGNHREIQAREGGGRVCDGNGNGGNVSAGSANAGSANGDHALATNGGAPSGPSSSRLVARPVGTVVGTTSGFWEYVPPHYGDGARYPLLVFWHGIGENGDGSAEELAKVTANGPPRVLKEDQWPEARNLIVLSPQHPSTGCPSSSEIHAFLQFALAHYEVDRARVYLAGLSCGAIGSWNYLSDHLDEVVTAAVLVCGDGRSAFTRAGCALGRVPIWALHGEVDPTVSPFGSIEPLARLNGCQPAPVDAKLTIYPGVAHDSWTRTYDLSAGNDVYGWLLSHRKP